MTSMLLSHHAQLPLPHSFPTRRSSDLEMSSLFDRVRRAHDAAVWATLGHAYAGGTSWSIARLGHAIFYKHEEKVLAPPYRDRKSTRLNSSHLVTSYAVLCLKIK